jgi:hypothetical protein
MKISILNATNHLIVGILFNSLLTMSLIDNCCFPTPHHHLWVLHLCFTHPLTSWFVSKFCTYASFVCHHHHNSHVNFALALLHLSFCVITLCLFLCIYHFFNYMPFTTSVHSYLYICHLHVYIFHNAIIIDFVAKMDNSTRVNWTLENSRKHGKSKGGGNTSQ